MSTPLIQTHDAIWTLLEGNVDFIAAVPAENRIKYTETSGVWYPDPDGAIPERFPCVRVVPEGFPHHTANDSAFHRYLWRFQVQVAAGQQYDPRVANIAWYVMCAMENWEDVTLGVHLLTWKGLAYIKDVRVLGEIEKEKEENPLTEGTRTWTAVWRGEVLSEHRRVDMIAANSEGS